MKGHAKGIVGLWARPTYDTSNTQQAACTHKQTEEDWHVIYNRLHPVPGIHLHGLAT